MLIRQVCAPLVFKRNRASLQVITETVCCCTKGSRKRGLQLVGCVESINQMKPLSSLTVV